MRARIAILAFATVFAVPALAQTTTPATTKPAATPTTTTTPSTTAPAASTPAKPAATAPTATKPGTTPAQTALHQRQAACGAEWRAAKAAGKIPAGQTWPKYWSACNARLKAQGK